ncbi:MAG: tetratricopeptide repeat protein [Bacteroidota bacterium]
MKFFKLIAIVWISASVFVLQAQVDGRYYLNQGLKLYNAKNYDEAINSLRRSLSVDSSQRKAYHLLAYSYLQLKNWTEAQRFAELGLMRYDQDARLYWLLGESQLQQSNFKDALSSYLRVEKEAGETAPKKNTDLKKRLGQCYSHLGTQAMEAEEKTKAILYFKKANQYLKNDAFTYVNLTLAYGRANEWRESLNTAESGLRLFPKNIALTQAKATAQYQIEDYENLLDSFKKLHLLQPEDLKVAITYGELLMSRQQYVSAAEHYNKLLTDYPKEKSIYESLIHIHESKLYYEGKVEVLNKMLNHFEKVNIYERITETYEIIENWSAARAYYDTLTVLAPEKTSSYQLKIASHYVEEDSLSQAIMILRSLAQKFPNDDEILNELGLAQEKAGVWSEALRSYQRLLEIKATSEVITRLGTAYRKTHHDAEAIHNYRRALAKEKNAEAMLGLSMLIKSSQRDSSINLALDAFQLCFEKLRELEDQLNNRLNGDKSLNSLISNKELLTEIKAVEQRATESFYHLSSYPARQVAPLLLALTQTFPLSARIHYLVAEYEFNRNKKKESEALLSRSIRLDPNREEAHKLLGSLYIDQGDEHNAILSFERCLALNNQQHELYGYLIHLYENTGRLDLLCRKWLIHYNASQEKETIKPHLIEALHKAGRYEEAQQIIQGS